MVHKHRNGQSTTAANTRNEITNPIVAGSTIFTKLLAGAQALRAFAWADFILQERTCVLRPHRDLYIYNQNKAIKFCMAKHTHTNIHIISGIHGHDVTAMIYSASTDTEAIATKGSST